MARLKVSKGKSYKGSKPKKVKAGKDSLKKAMKKWDSKYDVLK